MLRRLCITISEGDSNRVLKYVLRDRLGVSASVLIELKKSSSSILCNGSEVFANHRVMAGDKVEIVLADENSPNIVPCNIPLDIIYEDDDILAINKPHSMPTHPSRNHHDDTLANAVMWYYRDCKFTFRVITRLDRDTSGIVLIAKNKLSAAILTRQMTIGGIEKEYVAICHGLLNPASGIIDVPICRAENSAILREINPLGKKAVTQYHTEHINGEYSVVRLNPITGRTHQIRVHLSYMGCPIYGDDMYGSSIIGERTRLHCGRLCFVHPINHERIRLEASLPEDMKKFMV